MVNSNFILVVNKIDISRIPVSINSEKEICFCFLGCNLSQYSLVGVEVGHDFFDEFAVYFGCGQQTSHVGLGAPFVMADHLAASVVNDLEAQVAEPLVRLVECGVVDITFSLQQMNPR